jgi:hypothetical protein
MHVLRACDIRLLFITCLHCHVEFSVYSRIPVVGVNEGDNSKCLVWHICKTPRFTLLPPPVELVYSEK